MSDPLLPLLRIKNARGWPSYEVGARVPYHPLSTLLTTRYGTDAHFAAYSAPEIERRLVTDPPAYLRLEHGVSMVVLLLDVDCAAAHRALGGSGAVKADDAWWISTREKFEEVLAVHPGGFFYRTRGGARAIYLLEHPLIITTPAGELEWKRAYLSALAYLARRFGLVCDPSISDWPRLHRLPFVERDGVPQRLETLGDPRAVRPLIFTPTDADLDAARKLALTSKPWAAACKIMAQNVAPIARTGTQAPRPRAPRTTTAVGAPVIDAGQWAGLARDLGRAVRFHAQRHTLHLALAGACYTRGVPFEAGPALAAAICAYSGETDDRPQVWATTASRMQSGLVVQGYGSLRSLWPDVADILDTALPRDGGARAARDELDARGIPAAIPATEAAQQLQALFDAPPLGLSLVYATEGAGKTRAFAASAIRLAKSSAARSQTVYSRDRILFVGASHKVARTVFEELAAAGVHVEYWQSVLAVKSPNGEPACAYFVPVAALASGGQPPSAVFCDGIKAGREGQDAPCPRRKGCQAYDEATISANVVPNHGPRVVVTVHALLGAGLDWLGSDGLAVIDEDPEAVSAYTLQREQLEATVLVEAWTRSERWRNIVLRALAAGLERGDLPTQDALQLVFTRGCEALEADGTWTAAALEVFGSIEANEILRLAAIRAAYRSVRKEDGTTSWARKGSWAPRLHPRERALVFVTGRATDATVRASSIHATLGRLLAGVVRAAPEGAREHGERGIFTVEVAEGDGSRRVMRLLLASPAVGEAFRRVTGPTLLLDATADPQVLEAISGAPVPRTVLRVSDGAPMRRVLLYWSGAARKGVLSEGGGARWENGLRRYLHAAIDALLQDGRRALALFSYKTLVDLFRAGADPDVRAVFAAVQAKGATLVFGHYGDTRGKDDWKDRDGFVSIGDPRANLGASRAVAAALGLTNEWDSVYRRATAAEASQTAGRARAPWRTAPATWVHVGTVPPASWDSRAEVLELSKGPAEITSPAFATHLVEVHCSKRLAAADAGVDTRTIKRALAKSRVVTPSHAPGQVTLSNTQIGIPAPVCDCSESLDKVPFLAANPSTARLSPADLVAAVGGVAAAARLTGTGKATVYHWLARDRGRAMPEEARARLENELLTYAPVEEPTEAERREAASW